MPTRLMAAARSPRAALGVAGEDRGVEDVSFSEFEAGKHLEVAVAFGVGYENASAHTAVAQVCREVPADEPRASEDTYQGFVHP